MDKHFAQAIRDLEGCMRRIENHWPARYNEDPSG